jgi:hypothetical protein
MSAAEHFDLGVDTYTCQRTGKSGSGRAGLGYWAALTARATSSAVRSLLMAMAAAEP